MGQPQKLITLGPFKAIDTTSADAYVAEGVGTLGTGVNMHRTPLAMTAERGRVALATFVNTGAITFLSPYVAQTSDEQLYCVGGGQRILYDLGTKILERLQYNGVIDTSLPDQAIQIGQTLYDNAGRQYSSLSPNSTYDWQYAPFVATSTTINGITVTASSTAVSSSVAANFSGVTLQFSFTRITFGSGNAYAQESSAPSLTQGTNGAQFPAYLSYTFNALSTTTQVGTGGYTGGSTTLIVASATGLNIGMTGAISGDANTPTITNISGTTITLSAGGFASNHASGVSVTFTNATIFYPQITGTFTGTNDDGSTYLTNLYVSSNVLEVWYFAYTLTGANPYTSPYVLAMQSPSDFDANAQMTPTRDAPPVSPTNVGAIAYHKGAAWCLVVNAATITPTQNATSTPRSVPIQQMQLWWSKYGIPWEFDTVNNVNVLDANVPPNVPPYGGTYGEQPIALVSLSSVLLAWTTKNCFATYGDGTTQSPYVTRKLFNIGSRARHSWAVCILDQVGSVAIGLTENGVEMTDGQYAYRIDEPIRATLDSLVLSDRINAVGFFAHKAYYISFPALGETWAYYLPTGDWFGPLPYATTAAYAVPANPAAPLSTYGTMNEVTAVRGASNLIDSWFAGGDLDLGAVQTVTWTSAQSTCGEPRAQKVIERVSVNAPVQPGVLVTVTVSTEQGTWTDVCDLSKGPTSLTTVGVDGGGPLVGFLVACTVSMTTSATGVQPAQIWDVTVDGTMQEIVAFDNGAWS